MRRHVNGGRVPAWQRGRSPDRRTGQTIYQQERLQTQAIRSQSLLPLALDPTLIGVQAALTWLAEGTLVIPQCTRDIPRKTSIRSPSQDTGHEARLTTAACQHSPLTLRIPHLQAKRSEIS